MIKEIFSAQHDRDKIIFNCSFDILKMLLVFLDQSFVMSINIAVRVFGRRKLKFFIMTALVKAKQTLEKTDQSSKL